MMMMMMVVVVMVMMSFCKTLVNFCMNGTLKVCRKNLILVLCGPE